jgi:Ni,Fe-hydrogenase III large subunit
LANHFGDIGAIMVDTGFNFGGSNGARLREVVMQLNESLTGSRFLRGINVVGGCTRDIDMETARDTIQKLDSLRHDFSEVIHIAENTSSLIERLRDTGKLDAVTARDHGVVGIAGKAIGLSIDARRDYPYAAYGKFIIEPAVEQDGDVYARFFVRVKEVYSSIEILQRSLQDLGAQSSSDISTSIPMAKNSYAIGIVEGWRGDIVYLVATDAKGALSRVDVRDSSFLNWTALGHAGVGNMVPDFPLINKSFNLSYSGNDL